MTADLERLHPDLRRVGRMMLKFNFNRKSLKFIRLAFNFQPKGKVPAGVAVENVYISSGEPGQRIRLRVYRPDVLLPPAPALLWMHGGGFLIGKPEMDEAALSRFAGQLGLLVVSVDYRTAPEYPFPLPLDDCLAAFDWLHSQAQALGIDPGRIAVGGVSAGGGLAAALAQWAADRGAARPIFQMLVYPMLDDRTALRSDLQNTDLLTWSPESNRFGWESYLQRPCGCNDLPPYAVPARREDCRGLPPAWICVGTLDLFHDEDLAYAAKLRECGVACELLVIPGVFHGFDVIGPNTGVVEELRVAQVEALGKYV